jgi:hypothetical protein
MSFSRHTAIILIRRHRSVSITVALNTIQLDAIPQFHVSYSRTSPRERLTQAKLALFNIEFRNTMHDTSGKLCFVRNTATLLEPTLSQLNPLNLHFSFYSQNFVCYSRLPNLSKAPHRSHHPSCYHTNNMK